MNAAQISKPGGNWELVQRAIAYEQMHSGKVRFRVVLTMGERPYFAFVFPWVSTPLLPKESCPYLTIQLFRFFPYDRMPNCLLM